jgi:hypothetical protein
MRTARASIGGSLSNQLGGTSISNNSLYSVGKVFAVIMDENTPGKEVFQKYGEWGGVGTIFYLDYPTNKNTSNVRLIDCKVAKNFFPNQKHIPLREELVLLFDLPSPDTQDNQYKNEKYYISVINLWNNNHHNSQPANNLTNDIKLGGTFTENSNINPLLPFEGDTIFEGRNGNSLRFSSTTKYNTNENFWSITGGNGDPITLITNGHDFQPDSLKPYVEDPNIDKSSIYLTSTQKIPLRIRTLKSNKLFNPISPELYINSQVILSGDRVVLNAKNDEILLYANGIGLSSSNTIYLNSSKDILLEAPKIILGLDPLGNIAVEPLLKGNETVKLLSHIIKELKNLSTALSSVVSTPPGTPLISVNKAGLSLITSLNYITAETQDLQTLLSSKSYTI